MIIKHSKSQNSPNGLLNRYPDQFVSEKTKESKDWIKENMDFFASQAYKQFTDNCSTFIKNYDLVKGILRREDFYEEPAIKTFTDTLEQSMDLPKFVKHYPIMNPPLSELHGELSQRPDNVRCKAFDDQSKSEELQYRTETLQNFILSTAKSKILNKRLQSGELDPQSMSEEDLQAAMQNIDEEAYEKVKDDMMNYTSEAEDWSNHILEALKVEFNIKEKSEEAFRDLLICAREYYHVLEDNSNTGFRVETLNPKNVWKLTTPDKKYMKDAYAGGIVEIMELSDILDKYNISKEEVDHLLSRANGLGYGEIRESNLVKSNPTTGPNSVTYDVYDPLVEQYKMAFESYLKSDGNSNSNNQDYFGLANTVTAFGSKFVVVTSYWKSKKKVGKLVYLDENDEPQTKIVDENYKTIPEEISIEWGYINRWYKGIKIGPDIYYVEPYDLLDYCPIIGVIFENKNTEAKSLVDLMKPFQVIYNVCMNHLFKYLGDDKGKMLMTSLRTIPKLKGQDPQDAVEQWMMMGKELQTLLLDDSPENLKGTTGFNQHTIQDMSRREDLAARIDLAYRMKIECWQLVGFNPERLGSIAATQTATGTNAAMTQSYAQTEPYFAQHEYVLNDLYQAMVDAAQYILVNNPSTTLSYINSEGKAQFLAFNGDNIKMRDIKVFITNRAADKRVFDQLQQLSSTILQNGGDIADVATLYTSNSIRQMEHVYQVLKEEKKKFMMQEQQQKQQELEQQQSQFEQNLQYQEQVRQEDIENENYNKQLDRLSKERIAIIGATAFGKVESDDTNNNGVFDVLESTRVANEQLSAQNDHNINLQKLSLDQQKQNDSRQLELKKIDQEKEKLKVEREKIEAQKWIAKENKTAAELKARQARAKKKK